MAKVRITVVKRVIHQDLVDRYLNKERYPNGFGICPLWKDGQQFEVEGFPAKPVDFPCDCAWTDIQRDVAALVRRQSPVEGRSRHVPSVRSDGIRPVSFLVERVED
ncbi:MAG: TIGR04076 family protein [Candidatus Bipolaricaulota bacterium]|nr:TIGR04076 family protein [Candidatus Bipolaricaulota bacterium]